MGARRCLPWPSAARLRLGPIRMGAPQASSARVAGSARSNVHQNWLYAFFSVCVSCVDCCCHAVSDGRAAGAPVQFERLQPACPWQPLRAIVFLQNELWLLWLPVFPKKHVMSGVLVKASLL